jgi:hypothetical protein
MEVSFLNCYFLRNLDIPYEKEYLNIIFILQDKHNITTNIFPKKENKLWGNIYVIYYENTFCYK